MKTVLVAVFLCVAAGILLLVVLAALSRSGKPPGLVAGKLSMCPASPNCVVSEQYNDSGHYLEPVTLHAAASADQMALVRDVIVDMGGVIQQQDAGYIAAAFSTRIFGFVDDLEVRLVPGERLFQIR